MPEESVISQKRRVPIYLVTPYNLSMFDENKSEAKKKYKDSTVEVHIGYAYVD